MERDLLYLPMNTLKLVCLAFIQMVKQAWFLPQSVSNTTRQRRCRVVLNEREAERFDRIRNPWKYLGK